MRVDEKEERWWGKGVVEERRRLLLLSLFEQTRSFTSATRRVPDIMPLMSAPADSTIDVTLENFLSEESPLLTYNLAKRSKNRWIYI